MIGRRRARSDGLVRVLFVVPALGFGGAERHVVTLLPRMDPARFRPSLVCLHEAGDTFDDLAATGVPARSLDRPSRQAGSLLRELVSIMRRDRPDVVIAWGHSAEVLSRVAGVLAGVPRRAVWAHNCGELGVREWRFRLLDRVLEPVTSAVFAVAYGQIPYLTDQRGHPRDKIRVVYNGVEIAPRVDVSAVRDRELLTELGIAPDEPVVGIVAVLREEKDHVTLLRAFAQLLHTVPRARLLVVGDGPRRSALEDCAAELGITRQVVFTGARTDVPRLLPIMDVFTLSSRTIECFPMALLEAMAASRPAVATAVGGIPEMIEDGVTGHLVPVGDITGLAVALADLLTDPERAREMGEAARDRVEKQFSLERSVQAAEEAIAEIARTG